MSTLEPPPRDIPASDWTHEPDSSRSTSAHWSAAAADQAFIAGWPVWIPLAALGLVTLVFRWTSLDLTISSWFFDPTTYSWPWFFSTPCTLFYRGGTYPAFAIAVGGVALGLWGLLAPRRRWYALRAGTFLWVVFLVGPGVLVNITFKNSWGRPRPHQVRMFDGPHEFVPVLTRSRKQPHNASFPSGHAAVAFFLITPAFLVDRRRPGLARGLFLTGLAFGAAMSAVRVIQGGHFASDVVWSAAIVYFTCVACARVILNPRGLAPRRLTA